MSIFETRASGEPITFFFAGRSSVLLVFTIVNVAFSAPLQWERLSHYQMFLLHFLFLRTNSAIDTLVSYSDEDTDPRR